MKQSTLRKIAMPMIVAGIFAFGGNFFIGSSSAAGEDIWPNDYTVETIPKAAGASTTNGVDIEVSPDGRVFMATRNGLVYVIENDVMKPTPFLDIRNQVAKGLVIDGSGVITQVRSTPVGTGGLLGIEFDPNYAQNRRFYVHYTKERVPAPAVGQMHAPYKNNYKNIVVRYTADVNNPDIIDTSSAQQLFEVPGLNDPPVKTALHMGGDMHIGPDGKIFITSGDNGTGSNSANLGSLFGKLLRFNTDGSIPTDNPFYAQTSGDNRAIYATGLRNPFRFNIDPNSSVSDPSIYVNDVGANTWEEVTAITKGEFHGWEGATATSCEGPEIYSNPAVRTGQPCNNSSSILPLVSFAHNDVANVPVNTSINGSWVSDARSEVIVGGAFYRTTNAGNNPAFPADLHGKYFVASGETPNRDGWIKIVDPADGSVEDFARFVSGGPSTDVMTGMGIDNDGAMWVVNTGGKLQKVSYTGDYQGGGGPDTTPPTVSITQPANGATMQSSVVTVTVDATDADSGVNKVVFTPDGNTAAAIEDFSPPYSASFTLSDGPHAMEAQAFDNVGLSSTDTISFTVDTGSGGGQTNLLPNPGFESDPSSNYFVSNLGAGDGVATWDSTEARSGSSSAKMVATQPTGVNRYVLNTTTIPAIEGRTYSAGAYIKTENVSGTGSNVRLSFWDAAGTGKIGSTVQSSQINGTSDWTFLTISDVAPTDAAYVRIEYDMLHSGTMWIDDAFVYDGVTGAGVPVVTLVSPQVTDEWIVDQDITLSATATDEQDGQLGDAAFDWRVRWMHEDHHHDYLEGERVNGVESAALIGGTSDLMHAQTVVFNPWFADAQKETTIALEIELFVTDSEGNTTTMMRTIQPKLTTSEYDASPAGLDVAVDGDNITTQSPISYIEGYTASVSDPSVGGNPQMSGGQVVRLESVSATAPGGTVRYTANYTTNTSVSPDITGDGQVNAFDLSRMLAKWQLSDQNYYVSVPDLSVTDPLNGGDINLDRTINIFDLAMMLINWGTL